LIPSVGLADGEVDPAEEEKLVADEGKEEDV
jgi:hypothetical protein